MNSIQYQGQNGGSMYSTWDGLWGLWNEVCLHWDKKIQEECQATYRTQGVTMWSLKTSEAAE